MSIAATSSKTGQSERRVALITGGAKRVGRAIGERLASAGFDIVFTYNTSSDEALKFADQLRLNDRRALAIRADLTKSEEAVASIEAAFKKDFGRLDVLVNNASLYEPSSLEKTSVEQMRRFWAVHVESPLLLARAFRPQLEASEGHIVNMVDLLAERPWPQYLAFCTSKAGLVNLTLGLVRELAPNITVNGIAPGVVEWPDQYPESEKAKYLKRVPLARAGTPSDVANTVHFLVTGGTYITGQILRLDGGRSIT